MGIEKLLKNLQDYLNKGEKKKTVHCDRIDHLLAKLEEKKQKLEKKLVDESNTTKKKRLMTDIKIVTLQLKNGYKRREELSAKCK
ncbi:MAG: hypothetical protein PVG22_02450 [Chromatiales bacterium]|jgi:hypothetical protein